MPNESERPEQKQTGVDVLKPAKTAPAIQKPKKTHGFRNFLSVLVLLLIIIAAGLVAWQIYGESKGNNENLSDNEAPAVVNSFTACAAAGYPVQESYPRRCVTPAGKSFSEDIGNELEKADKIQIDTPRPNEAVTSPLTIEGQARGTWYFEATFPMTLEDASGTVLTSGSARATSDWMSEDFVPFEAELTFVKPAATEGTLTLHRANPSGQPAGSDELRVPVHFSP